MNTRRTQRSLHRKAGSHRNVRPPRKDSTHTYIRGFVKTKLQPFVESRSKDREARKTREETEIEDRTTESEGTGTKSYKSILCVPRFPIVHNKLEKSDLLRYGPPTLLSSA